MLERPETRAEAGASRGGSGVGCALRCVALVAIVLGASACFDARQTDPGSLLIDDFDRGAFPADPTFLPWMCYSFNPNTNQNYRCALDGDTPEGSAHSLRLDFVIADPVDGNKQHGGAGLVANGTPGLADDFRPFHTLGFDAQLQSGVPQLPSDAIFYALLGCGSVHLIDGSQPGDIYILQRTDYDQNWRQSNLALENFGFPDDARQVQGGLASCLQRVDRIAFQVDAQLPDGQSGAGILKIDGVYVR